MYKTIEELMDAIYNQSIEETRKRQMEFANEEKRLWREMMLKENEDMNNTKTFQEVIKDIKEGEVWSNDIKEIRLSPVNQLIIKSKINLKDNEMYFDFEGKYTLQRKKVSFAEAFAAYEQGKEIESCWSSEKYKKAVYDENKVVDCFWNEDRYVINDDGFDLDEIREQWYING